MINTLGSPSGDPAHDAGENLSRELALKSWLTDRSLPEIFAWFDAIAIGQVSSPYARKLWTAETVERDRLFLEKLGIKPDGANHRRE